MDFVATIPPSPNETLIIRRGSNIYHAIPIRSSEEKEMVVPNKPVQKINTSSTNSQTSRPPMRRMRRKIGTNNPIIQKNNNISSNKVKNNEIKPSVIKINHETKSPQNKEISLEKSTKIKKILPNKSTEEGKKEAELNKSIKEDNKSKNNSKEEVSDAPSLSQDAETSNNNLPIVSKEGENTIGDFMEYYSVKGHHHHLQGKSSHIYCRGDNTLIGKHTKHIYSDGHYHYIKSGVENAIINGSHAMSVNSGEYVKGIPFDINGIKKWGGAQETALFLVATVDNRGISNLKNPSTQDKNISNMIYLPNPDIGALVTLYYIISSIDKSYVMAGTATNVVKILPDGCSKWFNPHFSLTHNYNNFPSSITLSGVDLFRYNNAISIEVKNGENNGEVRLLAKAEFLCLQM